MVDNEPVSVQEVEKNIKKRAHIDDKYSEAWYELGSPIFLPSVKYAIAVIQYLVDNYFLIKNTYNALTTDDSKEYHHPKIIAGCIVGLHLFSSILISIIDSFNKDAISGKPGRYLQRKYRFIFFRILAHMTLTMKLFRYTTAYLENRRRNGQLHKLLQRRTPLSEQEIQFVVDQKKNNLVESHYDLVESFFKTVPAALLQVFFMFQSNPGARLRLYSTVDQDRFATVFSTIITASISSANYQADYMAYKKSLNFMDCFRSKFRHEINLKIPGDLCFISNIPIQIATIGIRMCFYSVIIFWSPVQFLTTLALLLLLNWILTLKWTKTAWRFRPVLENPLYGLPWFSFDMIDLWINLFVPGVHYPKPLDHFLNFYTTTFIGMIVFRGFDFLSPSKSGTMPSFLPEDSPLQNSHNHSVSSPSYNFQSFQYFNISERPDNLNASEDEETVYFIERITKILLMSHEFLTFNQISYAGFFYNVVKYMNIVNALCLVYTCLMNWLKFYDMDFPIQIANDFYLTIFNTILAKHAEALASSALFSSNQVEIFLVYNLLTNSEFFGGLKSIKKISWKEVNSEKLDEMVKLIVEKKDKDKVDPRCGWMHKILTKLAPIFYPGRIRQPVFDWSVPINKFSILNSVDTLPLNGQLRDFINIVYDINKPDRKLLLAVFCAQYNDIMRHSTSLRIQKTFEFMDIPIQKGQASKRIRLRKEGQHARSDYEIGYWQRFVREAKGDPFWSFP